MSRIQVFSTLSCLFLLSQCAPTIDHHGIGKHEFNINSVIVGKDTEEDVRQKLGSPSTISAFKEPVWYYISKVTSQKSFLTPYVMSQDVYAVTFSPSGVVKSLDTFNKDKSLNTVPNKAKTPTPHHEEGLFREIFSSFGRRLKEAGKNSEKSS
jgi:outer membrane protein assembly factor BamE (lipoprotein component of BamABCDE complex)